MTAVGLRQGVAAEAIRRHRLIVILRRVGSLERLGALIEELADAGARIFEVTFDDPEAADGLKASAARLAGRRDGPFLVGAGTIRTEDQLRAATAAGAVFGVSPTFNRGVLEAAIAAQLPFIPGAATPTEVETAWQSGATFVKLFPASSLGPSFVRELRGPMREVETIPTGGINAESARQFLEAGAVAVGIGSAFLKADQTQRRNLVAAISAFV
ncbi:MAG TPA: bifunctional 4-hydroxy-2-oxoglutarate aldolase/2-dehydro-3-deoxy-phosphogluconate aldolase [Candidatus Dormibacteraeota bacterium]|nr:bifunctional 4-hydroxy-2-oxoglutarate aldolase/2-dehydro-3-deoxy-phosphogluconate aldolase [Candidatus Dormibacteraeota bacterium]